MIVKIWLTIFLILNITWAHAQTPAEKPVLKRVVVLMRHGVRALSARTYDLDQRLYTDKQWPEWPVKPNQLTPHGYELVAGLGHYFRERYNEPLDISKEGCKILDKRYSRADKAPRTVETAKGFIFGLLPECQITLKTRTLTSSIDPKDYSKTMAAASQQLGDYQTAVERYRPELLLLQSILQCCSPVACNKKIPCSIFEVSGAIKPPGRLSGPLAVGGLVTQNFVLERAEGFPPELVGWGKVNDAQLKQLEALSSLVHNVNNRTPLIAQLQGKNLLTRIQKSLEEGTKPSTPPRITVIIGHDTNVGMIAGLLGLEWTPKTYAKNFIPPASALVFELYYYPLQKKYTVKTYFVAQTLAQMAKLLAPTVDNPPEWVPTRNKLCQARDPAECDYATWKKIAILRAVMF